MQWDMMEENDSQMKFLNDLEDYNKSMDNAFLIVTKRKTLDDIYLELENDDYTEFFLPFDPISSDGRDGGTLELLISHFEELEQYEKCAELNKLKIIGTGTSLDGDTALMQMTQSDDTRSFKTSLAIPSHITVTPT